MVEGSDAIEGSLRQLPLDEAIRIITQVMSDRPELAGPVMSSICPRIAYAPAKVITESRMVGRIKSFNRNKGYGFISCPQLGSSFSGDVFLYKAQLVGFAVEDQVSFAVLMGLDNRPRAFDLHAVPSIQAASVDAAPEAAALAQAAEAPALEVRQQQGLPQGSMHRSKSQKSSAATASSSTAASSSQAFRPGNRQSSRPPPPVPSASASTSAPAEPSRPHFQDTAQTARQAASGSSGQRYVGRVKSHSSSGGFGFIACDQVRAQYGRDAWVRSADLNNFDVGTEVSFSLTFNSKGLPQARHLEQEVPGEASRAQASPAATNADTSSSATATSCSGGPSSGAASSSIVATEAVSTSSRDTDSMFEGVTCAICQEVLHRATSIQPCLHSFCRSCISCWTRQSNGEGRRQRCPICREFVMRLTPNHNLESVIQGLLGLHPSRRRSAEDLAELDAREREVLCRRDDVLDRPDRFATGHTHVRRMLSASSAQVQGRASQGRGAHRMLTEPRYTAVHDDLEAISMAAGALPLGSAWRLPGMPPSLRQHGPATQALLNASWVAIPDNVSHVREVANVMRSGLEEQDMDQINNPQGLSSQWQELIANADGLASLMHL